MEDTKIDIFKFNYTINGFVLKELRVDSFKSQGRIGRELVNEGY